MSPDPDALDVRRLSVTYGDVTAVDAVDLCVRAGELVALLGPSGSGKTSLLHVVAGFLPPTSGEIRLAGQVVADARRSVPPERRDLAVVFQSYALWPHVSALDTVAYPIRRRGAGRREARDQAADLLERLHIGHLATRRPAELSGGEQQRVGLARALARNASLYLFDEPTAHLDSHVREVFLDELATRQQASGAGGLYATHDAAEAFGLADRIALLNRGRLVQLGTPQQVYEEPVDLWTARMTGAVSRIRAAVTEASAGRWTVKVAGQEVSVDTSADLPGSGSCDLLVRPGWARLGGDLAGRVRTVRFRGDHTDHVVESAVGEVLIRQPGPPDHAAGDDVTWSLTRVWPLGQTGAGQSSMPAGPE